MTYYEELAVAQNASLEEIRQAYRALARLLHPDNQSDPKLKSAAERQMIRLNEILATLADPALRRRYDESLCQKLAVSAAPPPAPPRPTLPLRRHGPWIVACCILVGVGLWYLRSNESGVPVADRGPAAPPERPAQAVQTAPAESEAPAGELRALTQNPLPRRPPERRKPSPPPEGFHAGENSAAGAQAGRSPAPSVPVAAVPGEARETAALPVQPSQAAPETPAQSQRIARQPGGPSFAGRWLYVPGSHEPRTPGMYPPAFIEFFLSEEQGALSGKYWARYRIPDKPVSPEVLFRVNGVPQKGNVTTLMWVSDDGANGQMKMVLRDADSMEVTWWTTAFGGQTALTSGTAVLVRQQAR